MMVLVWMLIGAVCVLAANQDRARDEEYDPDDDPDPDDSRYAERLCKRLERQAAERRTR
jgi:hypothetical protein